MSVLREEAHIQLRGLSLGSANLRTTVIFTVYLYQGAGAIGGHRYWIPGAGVKSSFVLPSMGAGNSTQVPRKISPYS